MTIDVPDAVRALAAERREARAANDYTRADSLRDAIAALGFAVIDGPDGTAFELLVLSAVRMVRLAAPVMYAMLSAVDVVLFVPENAEGAMELQLTLTKLDPDGPDGALADRWRTRRP